MKAGSGGAVKQRRERSGRLTGEVIGKGEGVRRKAESPRDTVMAAALQMLAGRPYSEADLRDRLVSRRRKDPKLVAECIKRLKELGYVNDDLFARSYATYRVALKPVGRAKLARELAVKKVARDCIEDALDLVYEENAEDTLIDRAIARRVRTRGRPTDRAASKRMFDHLARLGFEYDLIVKKLRRMKIETEENDE
jgi:regulatory protein